MADIKPFNFRELPKVSRQEATLLEGLMASLPRIGFSDNLSQSLKTLLGKLFGTRVSIEIQKIQSFDFSPGGSALPPQGVYLTFGLAPLQEKAVLELDPFLTHVAIDRLLGGTGEPPVMMRPLTEIEEGVLSYIFLKILAEIFERCGRSARLHFRLEGIRPTPEGIPGGSTLFLFFRISLGGRSGYARLILPTLFAQKALLEPLEGTAPGTERDLQYYAARFMNLGFLQTELWAEIGSATLKGRELMSLEPGDVVVMEKTSARFHDGRLEGVIPLKLGLGQSGALRGEVISGEGPLCVKMEGVDLTHPL